MNKKLFTASKRYRAAKARVIAAETEYLKLSCDEAANAVEAAVARFEAAKLELRQAATVPMRPT